MANRQEVFELMDKHLPKSPKTGKGVTLKTLRLQLVQVGALSSDQVTSDGDFVSSAPKKAPVKRKGKSPSPAPAPKAKSRSPSPKKALSRKSPSPVTAPKAKSRSPSPKKAPSPSSAPKAKSRSPSPKKRSPSPKKSPSSKAATPERSIHALEREGRSLSRGGASRSRSTSPAPRSPTQDVALTSHVPEREAGETEINNLLYMADQIPENEHIVSAIKEALYDFTFPPEVLNEAYQKIAEKVDQPEDKVIEATEALRDAGVSWNAFDSSIIVKTSEAGYGSVVRQILAHIEFPEKVLTQALSRAVLFDNASIVKILLEAGADANYQKGVLLVQSAKKGKEAVVKALVEAGADLYSYGRTATRAARTGGNDELADYLEKETERAKEETFDD